MDKGLAKTGSTFSLIGGILGIVVGLIAIGSSMLFKPYLYVGLVILLEAILVIVGSFKMKDEKKCFKWSVIVLILSLFGGGTIFGLIGGILGLVAVKR
ncbi:MAG: hypothetical protein WC852_04050 [Candidatus Nanoarchaeia archaeon]|jgi:uncharacterized membrane protein HdeD (DUF308 family)